MAQTRKGFSDRKAHFLEVTKKNSYKTSRYVHFRKYFGVRAFVFAYMQSLSKVQKKGGVAKITHMKVRTQLQKHTNNIVKTNNSSQMWSLPQLSTPM